MERSLKVDDEVLILASASFGKRGRVTEILDSRPTYNVRLLTGPYAGSEIVFEEHELCKA